MKRIISKSAERKVRFRILVFMIKFMRAIPRVLAIRIGEVIGLTVSMFDSSARKTIKKNASSVFGFEEDSVEASKFAKSVFKSMGVNVVESIRSCEKNRETLKKNTVVHGESNIENAVKSGRGVIILSAHFGAWELLGAYLAMKGYKVHAVARRLKEKRLDDLLDNYRKGNGLITHSRDDSYHFLKDLLLSGEMIGLVIDQDTKVKGIFSDFLGRPAHTPIGPALLALGTNSIIVPAYIYFNKTSLKHVITFEKPPDIKKTGDKKKDIANLTDELNRRISSWIMANPDQWVWFHERWKKKAPEGKTSKVENFASR